MVSNSFILLKKFKIKSNHYYLVVCFFILLYNLKQIFKKSKI